MRSPLGTVVVLPPREVGLLLGVIVPGVLFLALREVAAPVVVDARVASC